MDAADVRAAIRRQLCEEFEQEKAKRVAQQSAKQESKISATMTRPRSIADIGEEFYTPRGTRVAQAKTQMLQKQLLTPRGEPSPLQACYSSREAIRFHETNRDRHSRSLTPDHRDRSLLDRQLAAGAPSERRTRYDTPGGLQTSMGHTRSLTPDYYRRYDANVIGSSLPGAEVKARSDIAGNTAIEPGTPRGRRAAELALGQTHAEAIEQKAACRFHESPKDIADQRRHKPPKVCLSSEQSGSLAPRMRIEHGSGLTSARRGAMGDEARQQRPESAGQRVSRKPCWK